VDRSDYASFWDEYNRLLEQALRATS
jgi:hypothetical protein